MSEAERVSPKANGKGKAPLGPYLSRNPFGHPYTFGFFYREKMRAIHRIAPDEPFADILEVGGGQGGLTGLLYPKSRITNLDRDPAYASSPVNQRPLVRFLAGDATRLPFPNGSFDAVTMFDVLEHIPDDRAAAREALRVLRQGGALMVSSPNENWRFPYYGFLRPLCPSEEEKFAEWGHVRRGYSLPELEQVIGMKCTDHAAFINPVTVLCHDIAFSNLPRMVRKVLCTAISPVTWAGYAAQPARATGTETASLWRKV